MRFIVYSVNLLKKISLLEGIVTNNTILPILNNLLFDIDGDLLKITASDMETTMTLALEVEGEGGKGKYAVSVKMLSEILKALPEQPLTFNFLEEEYEMHITSEQGNYKMAFFDSESYPNIPAIDNPKTLKVPSNIISKGIEKTSFATSNDSLRSNLQGVLMNLDKDGITFVASDTHRLAKYTKIIEGVVDDAKFIIPKKPLKQLDKVLSGYDNEVKIEYNDSNVKFYIDNDIEIICRLIEGTFPDYKKALPTDNNNVLLANNSYISKAIKRVSIFSDRLNNMTKFNFSGNNLELSAEDVDFSNKAIEKLIVDYKGEDMIIGFNAKSLIEILTVLDMEEFSLEMSLPTKGCIIKPYPNEEGENIEMLLMPLIIN